MAYAVLAQIKFDLNITSGALDGGFGDWISKADEDVDNRIYEIAEKARRITELPILPFPSATDEELGALSPTIVSASNHFVKMRYYQRTRNSVKEKEEKEAAECDIAAYVRRLSVDKEFYIRIAR